MEIKCHTTKEMERKYRERIYNHSPDSLIGLNETNFGENLAKLVKCGTESNAERIRHIKICNKETCFYERRFMN